MISKEMFVSFDGKLSSEDSQDVINYEALFDIKDKVRGYVNSGDMYQLMPDHMLSDSIVELITFYKYAILEYFDNSDLTGKVETKESSLRKPRNLING